MFPRNWQCWRSYWKEYEGQLRYRKLHSKLTLYSTQVCITSGVTIHNIIYVNGWMAPPAVVLKRTQTLSTIQMVPHRGEQGGVIFFFFKANAKGTVGFLHVSKLLLWKIIILGYEKKWILNHCLEFWSLLLSFTGLSWL